MFLFKRQSFPTGWDIAYALAGIVFLAGIYLDGWAHNHIPQLESFFTPWHAVLYGGYLLSALVLVAWVGARRKHAKTWRDAIPDGHLLTIVGAAVFLAGGAGDLVWHQVFGIENDIDALLSPTHLVLATGGTLMASGGIRRFWRLAGDGAGAMSGENLILTLSIIQTLATVFFMTQFAHYTDFDFLGTAPTDGSLHFYKQGLPLLGLIFLSISIAGTLSVMLRRGQLPPGCITITFTALILGLGLMRDGRELIVAGLVAGLAGDFTLHWNVRKHQEWRKRLACIVPAPTYVLCAMLIERKIHGIWLSVHMWTGAVVIAGIAAYLTTVIAWPQPLKD